MVTRPVWTNGQMNMADGQPESIKPSTTLSDGKGIKQDPVILEVPIKRPLKYLTHRGNSLGQIPNMTIAKPVQCALLIAISPHNQSEFNDCWCQTMGHFIFS